MTINELEALLKDLEKHHAQVHLRYCQTLSVQPGWEGLKLFAAAPEIATQLLGLLKKNPDLA